MVRNSEILLRAAPLVHMYDRKIKEHGVSYGLSEAGYDVRIKQNVVLHPLKRFVLASTREKFRMPTDLVAIVHDKSTWARRGLSVFNTVIEPGWNGYLTLELVYHGWKILKIPAGAGIAQVVFHVLETPQKYDGKYQDQENKPIPARISL